MMRRLLAVCLAFLWPAACTEERPPAAPPKDAGMAQVAAATPKAAPDPYADWVPHELGKHQGGATHVAVSPDGRLAASGGRDKLVKIWSLSGGEPKILAGHGDEVSMVAFSPDGQHLASVSRDQTAMLWEVASGKRLQVLKDKPPREKDLTDEQLQILALTPPPLMNFAAFSADGKQLMTASDDFALKLWDLKSGKKLLAIQDVGCRQRSVYRRLDAPGWISAAGCMEDGVTYLKFWDTQGGLVNQEGDAEHDAHYLAFDPAGRWIVAGDGSLAMTIYSAQGSRLQRVLAGGYHFCLAFGRKGNSLLVGAEGGRVLVFEPITWQRRGVISAGRAAAVDGLAVNPADGSLLLALRDGEVLRFSGPID